MELYKMKKYLRYSHVYARTPRVHGSRGERILHWTACPGQVLHHCELQLNNLRIGTSILESWRAMTTEHASEALAFMRLVHS